MNACRIVDFLSRMAVIRPWTGRIVERHAETCRVCRPSLIDKETARTILVAAEKAGRPARRGHESATGLRNRPEARRRGLRVRLFRLPALSGAAAVLVLVVSGFWLLHRLPTTNGPIASTAEESFRISRIEIEGEPANAYIYRPRGTDMVIVWAERKI